METTKETKVLNIPFPDHVKQTIINEPYDLTIYLLKDDRGWVIEPASIDRDWMESHQKFAYRCLPLTIANQAGWVIRCPVSFVATWNGGIGTNAIYLDYDEPVRYFQEAIHSHFGNGIITFNLPYLFRCSCPGLGLLVRGLPNYQKYNCTPLEGFVETDWLPFTFTMNWRFDRPNIPVQFSQGDPICFVQPLNLSKVEAANPIARKIEENPELKDSYEVWKKSRTAFNADPTRDITEWQVLP